VSLTIPSGQTVGICGQTGCGKSTLLRLLARLYDVQGGSIVLNGRDIRDFEPAWLREQVAFVTSVKVRKVFGGLQHIQYSILNSTDTKDIVFLSVKDTFLFSTTVRENIEFGVSAGLGRIVASYNRPSTSYQIH
jgi:ABC-type multidrug transport system fused ATPase/permease subunit